VITLAELHKGDVAIILQILSNMLRFVGISMLVPAIVSYFYGELLYAQLFFEMAIILIVVFSILYSILGHREAKFKHAVIAIALGWFLVGLIGMFPFLPFGMQPVDAFFESMSGWSTTGLTMVQRPEELPYSLNFWRGFIQWLGGFGIVILALMLYERPKTAQELFHAEGRTEDFYTNLFKIARIIVGIYLIYTILGIILFLISGLNLFDATIHSFTCIATGGFSTNSVGIGIYGHAAMASAIIIMLAGGISFVSHRELMKGNIKGFFSNPEVKFLFVMLISSTLLIFLSSTIKEQIFDQFFYAVSALTGTGATSTLAVNTLPPAAVFVLIMLMVCGACYGSTAGAIKLWRILIVFKVIRREIYKALLPQNAVLPIKIGGKTIPDENALNAIAYFALYIMLLLFGSIVFMLAGYGTVESIFTVASAQGNVGLNVISGARWFGMNAALKILLSFHMILGRMEIIPFLVMLKSFGIIKRP